MVIIKNGCIPSPISDKDKLLSNYMPAIKRYPEVFLPPFDLDVLNQGTLPHCVGFACSVMKQYMELRERNYKVFDGSWIYNECKKIDGMPNFPGTYLRSGLTVLKTIGAKTDNEDPSKYKIKMFAKVDDLSFEGIKKAICLYGIVLAGFTGSNNGWRGEVIRPPKSGESTWGHAVAITGYEKNYLIGQNSWSKNNHKNGLFKVPSNYLPFEAWTIVLDDVNEPQETGWVANMYLRNNITTTNLNCRVGAGLGFRVIKVIPKGTQVQPTGNSMRSGSYNWVEVFR